MTAMSTGVSQLRMGLLGLAKRSAGLLKACNNEASVKLYLVLPMIGLLGYDSSDPLEVYPNHETDHIEGVAYRADFAILNNGSPLIAFAAGKTADDVAAKKASLTRYFNAWPTARLGVLSNGIVFEYFVDSITPGVMDVEPFLVVDLNAIASGGVSDDVIETLIHATKDSFNADMIAETAHLLLVRARLRTAFAELAQAPSPDLCRLLLERIGFTGVRDETIARHYAPLVKTAFDEALVLPAMQKLRASGGDVDAAGAQLASAKLLSSERDLAMFNATRRRLAYLANDEAQFKAIDKVDYRVTVGRISVFLGSDPRGRLFEVVRGSDGYEKYVFPAPYGEVSQQAQAEFDQALYGILELRVREQGQFSSQGQLSAHSQLSAQSQSPAIPTLAQRLAS
jgi:predicted type IV restriction endonuclease